MTPLETLKAARQLITDPAKWTQEAFARNKLGQIVEPDFGDATCFCALGAIQHFTKYTGMSPADVLLDNLSLSKFGMCIDVFNDTHTHAEVLALFDAAIAELEGVAT
jgi:hypothetical protein